MPSHANDEAEVTCCELDIYTESSSRSCVITRDLKAWQHACHNVTVTASDVNSSTSAMYFEYCLCACVCEVCWGGLIIHDKEKKKLYISFPSLSSPTISSHLVIFETQTLISRSLKKYEMKFSQEMLITRQLTGNKLLILSARERKVLIKLTLSSFSLCSHYFTHNKYIVFCQVCDAHLSQKG